MENQKNKHTNHSSHDHSHHDCCGHDHHHDAATQQNHQHDPHHGHGHEHQHDHHHHGPDCGHDHHHGPDCGHDHHHGPDCGHEHHHGHQHLSREDCSAIVNQAQESTDPAETLDLLLIAGEGYAHLGDTVGTAAVNGLVAKLIPTLQPLSKLKNAQINALHALGMGLEKPSEQAKSALAQCVTELEDFTGEAREEIEPLLADVRKTLAGMRTTGLKSLLKKLMG